MSSSAAAMFGISLIELLVISAPFLLCRVGGYFHWLLMGSTRGELVGWYTYYQLKPAGFFAPELRLWTIQLCWIVVVFYANSLILPGFPMAELLVLSAPFLVCRAGAYLYWLAMDSTRDEFVGWRGYQRLKPFGFWIPEFVLWPIQLCWVFVLIILNFVLGGSLLGGLF